MKTSKYILYIGVALLMSVSSSCTFERLGTAPDGNDLQVRVAFASNDMSSTTSSKTRGVTTSGTEQGTTDENRLERVTILIFNSDGTKLETSLSVDVTDRNSALDATHPHWKDNSTLLVKNIVDPANPKIIYAIANYNLNIAVGYTVAKLKAELKTIKKVDELNGPQVYPMVMCGNKYVESLIASSYKLSVDMSRQSAKLKTVLSVSKQAQDNNPQIRWETDLARITVVNIPNKSYLVGQSSIPPDHTLLKYENVPIDDTKPGAVDQQKPATKDLVWTESMYVNENPAQGEVPSDALMTYMVIQIPYTKDDAGSTSAIQYDNYYKLYINDTRWTEAASPYKVLRNTFYTLSINILGLGSSFDNLQPDANVDTELKVEDWTDGQHIEIGDEEFYLNIDQTRIEFELNSAPSATINIATNVNDWEIMNAGKTFLSVSKNIKYAKDAFHEYTLAGTAPNYTLKINQLAYGQNTPKAYSLQAKNIKVPIVVANDNGYIPRERLIIPGGFSVEHKLPKKGSPVGATDSTIIFKYPEWTTNIPTNGIQIAKRQNILRSTIVEDDASETYVQWASDKVAATPISGTSRLCGYGPQNTAKIVAVGQRQDYPAAWVCRDLGPEWYLPSVDEWAVIRYNKELLGYSYLFYWDGAFPWSSTQFEAESVLSLFINQTSEGNTLKKELGAVRCIRNL